MQSSSKCFAVWFGEKGSLVSSGVWPRIQTGLEGCNGKLHGGASCPLGGGGAERKAKLTKDELFPFAVSQRAAELSVLWQQLQLTCNSVLILTGWLYSGHNHTRNVSDLTQVEFSLIEKKKKNSLSYLGKSSESQAIHETSEFAMAKEGDLEKRVPALSCFHPASRTTRTSLTLR